MKILKIFAFTVIVFALQNCSNTENVETETNAIPKQNVQNAAKSLLTQLGIGNYLSERHHEHVWSHKNVPSSNVLPNLIKWQKEIGMADPLPASQVCVALANVIRKRAGYKVYGGRSPGYIPSVFDDLLNRGGERVSYSQVSNGDFASGGGHAGVVVQISTGEKKVLAFTGSFGSIDAQILPVYDTWEFYRTEN
jgi:hypothetical protein